MPSQRIITAIVIVAVLGALVFWMPSDWFRWALIPIALVAGHELGGLAGAVSLPAVLTWALATVLVSIVALLLADFSMVIYGFAILLWVVIIGFLFKVPPERWMPLLSALTCLTVIAVAVLSVSQLHYRSVWWLLGLFLVVCLADTVAYYSGRRFGRRKLAERLSPGKTVEGVIGGLLAVLAAALAVSSVLWPESPIRSIAFAAFCVVVALFSIAGDLFVSALKRSAGVKDSGRLLPGHGGILDRIDSTLSAAPVYVLGTAFFLDSVN